MVMPRVVPYHTDRSWKGSMRENGFRALGGLAQRLASGVARGRGASIARLRADWPAIVGSEMARVSRPEALIAGRGGPAGAKLLRLRVSGAASLEIQHSSSLIVQRVNAYFGHRQIDDIRLVQGVMPQVRKSRPVPPPDAATAARIGDRVAGVQDPDLKAALARLGARIAVTRRGALVGTLGTLLSARESRAQALD